MRPNLTLLVLLIACCGTAEAGLIVHGMGHAATETRVTSGPQRTSPSERESSDPETYVQLTDAGERGLSGSPTSGGAGAVAAAMLSDSARLMDPREIDCLHTHDLALPPPPEPDGLIKPPQPIV